MSVCIFLTTDNSYNSHLMEAIEQATTTILGYYNVYCLNLMHNFVRSVDDSHINDDEDENDDDKLN